MKKLLLLLIPLLCAAVLVSCGKGDTDPQGSGTDTAEEERVRIPITEDYTIIRADKMSENAIKASSALRTAIFEKYGLELPIKTDWTPENKENNTVESGPEVHEILIGATNRAETANVAEELEEIKYGFAIRAVNGKLVIWGSNDEALGYAIDYFTEKLMTEDSLTLEQNYSYLWNIAAEGGLLESLASEYRFIYNGRGYEKEINAAKLASDELSRLYGKAPELTLDQSEPSAKEILIGGTNRPESAEAAQGLGYMDYTVRVKNGKIVIVGGSPLATVSATEKFLLMLRSGQLTSLDEGMIYELDFDKYLEASLIHKIDSFVPVWANEFTPPSWLLDPEEKLYAMTTSTGRFMSDAHRGDTQHYPENSLEGILSAIMMGADAVEIDFRLTKDNVLVLMHDSTLKRTTDWSKKKGKNGLPSSNDLSDWTYEELQKLNLLFDGEPTEYKIPTAYEAVMLFRDRPTQLHLDCKADGIDDNSDIYLLAEATGTKSAFTFVYAHYDGVAALDKWVSFDRSDKAFSDHVGKLKGYLVGAKLRRCYFDTLNTNTDDPAGWKKSWDQGYRMTVTNRIYDLCRYIAENQKPFGVPQR